MRDLINSLGGIITKDHVLNLVSATVIVLAGLFISRRANKPIDRLTQLDAQQRIIFGKIARYGVLALTAAAALSQLGFDLRVVLGAAGVLTVAVGFAAQTSASNLISGIFLMIERPFVNGDVVQVGDIQGEVVTIDLLSTKLRTAANLMVRIPNETMVKSNIVNFSYFPIRRVEFSIGVGYGSDLGQVERLLREAAETHPLCLEEPEPVFMFQSFGDSAINVQIHVWTVTANVQQVKNDLNVDIKTRFDAAGIDIPYPIRTLLMPGLPPGQSQTANA
jgi:small-conductance mechanosensitive channel